VGGRGGVGVWVWGGGGVCPGLSVSDVCAGTLCVSRVPCTFLLCRNGSEIRCTLGKTFLALWLVGPRRGDFAIFSLPNAHFT